MIDGIGTHAQQTCAICAEPGSTARLFQQSARACLAQLAASRARPARVKSPYGEPASARLAPC